MPKQLVTEEELIQLYNYIGILKKYVKTAEDIVASATIIMDRDEYNKATKWVDDAISNLPSILIW